MIVGIGRKTIQKDMLKNMSTHKRLRLLPVFLCFLLFSLPIFGNCCNSAELALSIGAGEIPITQQSLYIIDNTKDIVSQFNRQNTIYEVRDVLDLKGQCVNIPKGCCLYFNGGGVTNGAINGLNTRLFAPYGRVFGKGLSLKGTFLSDVIKVSWWASLGASDNTNEVQQAFNAIAAFVNRCFVFDIPIRITDVSYALKYFPGTSFSGVSNSHQHDCAITVFGNNSQGIDISGTEILQFSNLLIQGDPNDPPKSLIYASRLVNNKQTNKHCFRNVSFRGDVTKAFVYNYGGEEWTLENCEFNYSGKNNIIALFYATSVNNGKTESKFSKTETKITSVTYSTFNQCHFVNSSLSPTVYFEGGANKGRGVYTVASVFFNQCYFTNFIGSSVRFKDVSGAVSFINNIDESGAVNTDKRSYPFYLFEGDLKVDGLVFINNTYYAKNETPIVLVSPIVENYFASSNKIINNGAIWSFKNMKCGTHLGLSKREKFVVSGTSEDVEVHNGNDNQSNIIISRQNGK